MTDHPLHPEHVAVVASAANELEASVIVASLEAEGIKSTMAGAAAGVFRLGVPGDVQILVAQEDVARAEAIIREGEDDQEDVDWSKVDVGQPEE